MTWRTEELTRGAGAFQAIKRPIDKGATARDIPARARRITDDFSSPSPSGVALHKLCSTISPQLFPDIANPLLNRCDIAFRKHCISCTPPDHDRYRATVLLQVPRQLCAQAQKMERCRFHSTCDIHAFIALRLER